jgi:metallophosphoesterase superfamily enzyme
MTLSPFALLHHPGKIPGLYSLAGHLHPGIRLTGAGRQRLKLPCFWLGKEVGVLPAFGDFTGLAMVEPAENDRVFVVTPDSVLPITASKPCRTGGVQ